MNTELQHTHEERQLIAYLFGEQSKAMKDKKRLAGVSEEAASYYESLEATIRATVLCEVTAAVLTFKHRGGGQ